MIGYAKFVEGSEQDWHAPVPKFQLLSSLRKVGCGYIQGMLHFPRFSLRTLLILTAMLGFLFWAWPWMEWADDVVTGTQVYIFWLNPPNRELTPRFERVALAEIAILVLWGMISYRRRHPQIIYPAPSSQRSPNDTN